MSAGVEEFLRARDLLLAHAEEYERARRDFRWPRLERFNWALDYFDRLAEGNRATAFRLVDEDGRETRCTFSELSERSNRVANHLRRLGVRRGDRVLLMLENVAPLWESVLACMKLGAVVIPATTQLTPRNLDDRIRRGAVSHVVAGASSAEKFSGIPGGFTRISVEGEADGWRGLDAAACSARFEPDGETASDDPFLLYFTSGTTSEPKLVCHTHASYPMGHLSTMYWIGLREGDLHWNISSPGWAKHAWSSFFAPWNAGATVFAMRYERFDPAAALEALVLYDVTTLCAPPTVWRLLLQEKLGAYEVSLREAVSAGEPLNPEVVARVREAWGITVRDGYGQTETTAQIGNSPGQVVKPGSMGRPLPGYAVTLLDPEGREVEEGEICLPLEERPLGLMSGYEDDPALTDEVMRGGHYHTRDVATRDEDGYFRYVGRTDDLFKSSDYRISPFEIENVLIEHEAVGEAAVVPSPHPTRLSVPKAFIGLAKGFEPGRDLAREILVFARERLAPFQRVRRLEFSELPKTVSGKIRRVELRRQEEAREREERRGQREYDWEDDFSGRGG